MNTSKKKKGLLDVTCPGKTLGVTDEPICDLSEPQQKVFRLRRNLCAYITYTSALTIINDNFFPYVSVLSYYFTCKYIILLRKQ